MLYPLSYEGFEGRSSCVAGAAIAAHQPISRRFSSTPPRQRTYVL
jgi:hypothetical protein